MTVAARTYFKCIAKYHKNTLYVLFLVEEMLVFTFIRNLLCLLLDVNKAFTAIPLDLAINYTLYNTVLLRLRKYLLYIYKGS